MPSNQGLEFSASIYHLSIALSALVIPLFRLFQWMKATRPSFPGHKKIGYFFLEGDSEDQSSSCQPPGRLQGLFIYPVKSCQGISLQRSKVIATGLEFDRLFTFAQLPKRDDDANGKEEEGQEVWQFLTQRQKPLLATLVVELWLPDADRQLERRHQPQSSGGFVAIKFPWRERGLSGLIQWINAKFMRGWAAQPERQFTLPLAFPTKETILSEGHEYANIKIWKETVLALNMEYSLPQELRQYLGMTRRLGLFRMDPAGQREVFRCAPRREAAKYQPIVDFHDAYPLHLLTLSSVQDLESKMQKDDDLQSLDVRRFRANMIGKVSGTEPYDEETWRIIRIGNKLNEKSLGLFDVSCRTVRCKMPNIDATTGARHHMEPDYSLRKHRDVDEGAPKWGCLGMQLCPLFPEAEDAAEREFDIEVGMECSVLERGNHLYIPQ